MRAWGRNLALALLLSAALPTVTALAAETAEEVLLDKASYWRLKDRPDLAAEALNKLLEINPNNPEALYQYGVLSVQQNKPADAQRYLAKLQQVAPDSPHIADLENAIRAGKIGSTDLDEARRLTQGGQTAEAIKKYREIFKGPPPSTYGVEYYMTLAGTPEGWDEARQGMEKLARESPNDPQIKLALAQIYTYRESTRMQGIDMLAELTKNQMVAANAVKSWRQALTWLGGSPAAKAAYQKYLAQYPQDSDIQQLLADLAKQPAGGAMDEAQSKAYADLKRGNIAAAERQFAADLRAHPDDVQALAGLGLIRLRQQRFAEARALLGRAIKAAPDEQKDLAAAYESATFWAQVNDAKRMAAAGNYTGAQAFLTRLLSRPHRDNWGAEMVLGDVETKMGQNAAAEATYRRVLRARPGNSDALMGLANALRAQNKTAELTQLTSRMSPAIRARFERSSSGNSIAEKLRNEAKAASANGDAALATAKFREAMAADPRSP
ncbi:MAG TPA: tetratricopeptide repeat protein, partial [Stellaceae bacterium]|nr:tetratricopeptide repeat protein [Stellaceae bacterium]